MQRSGVARGVAFVTGVVKRWERRGEKPGCLEFRVCELPFDIFLNAVYNLLRTNTGFVKKLAGVAQSVEQLTCNE